MDENAGVELMLIDILLEIFCGRLSGAKVGLTSPETTENPKIGRHDYNTVASTPGGP